MRERSNPRIAGVQRVTGFLWIILVLALLVGVQGVWGAGFGVANNQITITTDTNTYTPTIDQDGLVDSVNSMVGSLDSLEISLIKDNVNNGTYSVDLSIIVDDADNDRRIEAFLPGIQLEVAGSDTTVTLPASKNLRIAGRSADGNTTFTTTLSNTVSDGPVTATNNNITFSLTNLQDKINAKFGAASGNAAILNNIVSDGKYSYTILVKSSSIPIGSVSGATVTAFPSYNIGPDCGEYGDNLSVLSDSPIANNSYLHGTCYVIRGSFGVGTGNDAPASGVAPTYNGSCPSSSTGGGGSGAVDGGTVAPGETGSVSAGATVSDVTNEGTIKNSGTIQDSTNKGTIEGGTVAGTITNTGGTLKDVAVGENAVVKGGSLEGAVTIGEGASLENVTVAANATVNFSGADIVVNIVTESGSKMVLAPGSTMHGVVSSSEGASLNIPEGAIVTITGSSITIQFSKPSIPVPGQATITALTVPVLPVQYTLVDALTVSPDGATLAKPATVTIPYDNTMIPASFTQTDLKVLALDPTTMQWKEISVTSVTDDNVTIDTDIMSTYAVVVSSLYPVISTTVGNVVDPESVSTTIEDALKEIFSGQSVIVNPDKTSGILNVNIDGALYPISAIGTGITGSQNKASFELKDSGLSAQFILSDGTTIRIVPMAADPQGLSDLFIASNFTVQFQPDYGMVLVKDTSNNMYAGMFGWTAGSIGTKAIDGFNSTDGIINIVYKDGSTQTLAPVLGSIQNFITDLNNAGIAFNIDRNTGIINLINPSSCWIPDYTIEPLPFTDLGEYIPNKDAYGIYFKVNNSSSNIEMWTNVSKQLIMQTQCK